MDQFSYLQGRGDSYSEVAEAARVNAATMKDVTLAMMLYKLAAGFQGIAKEYYANAHNEQQKAKSA